MKDLFVKDYQLFTKILIANRGEIAVRIIRACHELNIKTVAVHSTSEKDALHVQLADESVCIGPGPIKGSYANHNSIIQAAISTNCQAIHPGYGFLSENAEFAKAVQNTNLIWIGPDYTTIKKMGDKIEARKVAEEAKVPVAKGSETLKTGLEAEKIAKKIGFPVIVKAASGGGGRGIIIVHQKELIQKAFNDVLKVAKSLYNDKRVYVEKYITNPRHVEVQILADHIGNVRHLYERDCSMQRRNQKLIEEAPSGFITTSTRKKITEAAVAIAKKCEYKSAGTVEFLVDNKQNFYFMEMNTRIQVEHPITEQITNIDIVKEQIKFAAGKKIDFKQKDISINGHAIEIRINAENPVNDFFPSTGKISFVHFPGGKGVRIDSDMYNKYFLPSFYDSMIAKIIVHSKDRPGAILKAKRALEELIIEGIKTNIDFQYHLILTREFLKLTHTTKFVEDIFLPRYLKREDKKYD